MWENQLSSRWACSFEAITTDTGSPGPKAAKAARISRFVFSLISLANLIVSSCHQVRNCSLIATGAKSNLQRPFPVDEPKHLPLGSTLS